MTTLPRKTLIFVLFFSASSTCVRKASLASADSFFSPGRAFSVDCCSGDWVGDAGNDGISVALSVERDRSGCGVFSSADASMDGFAVADDVASAVAAVGCVAFRGAFSEEPQPAKALAPIALKAITDNTFSLRDPRNLSAQNFPSFFFPPLSLYHHWWMMPILDL